MLTKQFTLQPLRPAFSAELAVNRPVKLPAGGPYGTGGKFAKGTVLGNVGGTAADEVRTLTVSGSPTGTKVTLTFVADKVYTATTANPVSTNATLAEVQAAAEEIFGAGNVTVTGTPGSSYVLTFSGALEKTRIGGSLTVSATFTGGTTPAIAHARTTPGSAGAGQFDAYVDAGTNNAPTTARAILMYDYLSDPAGGDSTEAGSTLQPYSPVAYFAGYFKAADLTGLDAAAVADPGFRLVEGAAITDTGAVVGLGV